ncbi:MAG: DNA cytosine methyltransferase [Methylococcales bacterium]|nr:DNA cytosine methyltransferase [Methylococcales bacterium]
MYKFKKAVDLFCGCGGISVGLEQTGFELLAGMDIEKKYLASFKHNFPKAKALNIDITQTAPSDFMDLVEITANKLDILVGGPPCQGFSKNVPLKNRYLHDPKNLLVNSFLDYCEVLRPKMILMENVAEMKNGFEKAYSQEVISRLENEGYTVTSIVLNAADYGVPQRRRRAFFIANQYGLKFESPLPTHYAQSKENSEIYNLFFSNPQHINVWDAIGDLPKLEHGEGQKLTHYTSLPQNNYQEFIRGNCELVTNHIARKLQPIQYERLSSLEAGQGLKDLPIHLQTKGGYSGAYGRLTKNMIAPTITRWVFHPGSGRWGHPVDIRTLTMREVARIQSFPDNYEFVGSYNEQAGQLGNAVPPLLAKIIIQSMNTQLERFKKETKSSQLTFSVDNLNAIA